MRALGAGGRFLALERSGAQQLGVSADGRQRRAELVRGVGDELAEGLLGRGAGIERRVQRVTQPRDFIAAADVDPAVDLTRGDCVCRVGNVDERTEPDAHEPKCEHAGEHQQDHGRDALDPVQARQRRFDAAQRRDDNCDVGAAGDRFGDRPVVTGPARHIETVRGAEACLLERASGKHREGIARGRERALQRSSRRGPQGRCEQPARQRRGARRWLHIRWQIRGPAALGCRA